MTSSEQYGIIPPVDTIYSQAKVAQLVEHSTENAGVVGSIPSLGMPFKAASQADAYCSACFYEAWDIGVLTHECCTVESVT